MQEALNASDDIKSITGIYDASLGARSNETSGRAIMARQREGDVSTFHFIDNLSRAIRHTGRVIIDLVPSVYNAARIVRVIGEDGSQTAQPVNQPAPKIDQQTGQPVRDEFGNAVMAIHDLTVGKYDLTVSTGPSYTTARQETADQMMQLIQAYPAAAPLVGDILVKSLDWQGADEIAERIRRMIPAQAMGEQAIPPEVKQLIDEGKAKLAELTAENEQLKIGAQVDMAKAEADKQAKLAKIRSDEEAAFAEIQSRERIAAAEIASRERIAAAQASIRAQQPQQASTN
jgi:hypothetical protein